MSTTPRKTLSDCVTMHYVREGPALQHIERLHDEGERRERGPHTQNNRYRDVSPPSGCKKAFNGSVVSEPGFARPEAANAQPTFLKGEKRFQDLEAEATGDCEDGTVHCGNL
eukprot:GHVS01089070.1.p3 GENE.GHVS01089070.1~~GHVS01089070.1.p3  ORF type:complete len:112 (+),score=12.80 GHVS01089070.1:179-514(+)